MKINIKDSVKPGTKKVPKNGIGDIYKGFENLTEKAPTRRIMNKRNSKYNKTRGW